MNGQELMTQEKNMPEKYSIVRPPTFKKQYATNVFVTITDSDFRIELFNEKFKTDNGWVYQSEEMLILTKEAAKKLSNLLEEKIKQYEKENGEIQVSEDRMQFNYLI
jgi:wobble nucleotide-excising tRNase